MDFDKLTNESTGGTIVKIKRPLKLILISLGILIFLILVITTISIIFAIGENFSENATYEFHSSLNRYHSVKLSVFCRIPGAPNAKCPGGVKTFEELEERGMLTLLKTKRSLVDVYFSGNILTIENSSTVHLIKRVKFMEKDQLTAKEKEGFVYHKEDFEQNWRHGVKKLELNISFDANLESVLCSAVSSESSSPVGCSIGRKRFAENVITLFKGIFGATRLNGTVTLGDNRPWLTSEFDVTAHTDGETVTKYVQQFIADDIAICKCLENTDPIVTHSEEAEDLEVCFKTLKIRKSVQEVMKGFDKSRC